MQQSVQYILLSRVRITFISFYRWMSQKLKSTRHILGYRLSLLLVVLHNQWAYDANMERLELMHATGLKGKGRGVQRGIAYRIVALRPDVTLQRAFHNSRACTPGYDVTLKGSGDPCRSPLPPSPYVHTTPLISATWNSC